MSGSLESSGECFDILGSKKGMGCLGVESQWRMFSYFGLRIRNGLSGSWEPVENVFIFWAPDKECIVWELGASGYISYFGLQIRNGLSGSLESGGECFDILGSEKGMGCLG